MNLAEKIGATAFLGVIIGSGAILVEMNTRKTNQISGENIVDCNDFTKQADTFETDLYTKNSTLHIGGQQSTFLSSLYRVSLGLRPDGEGGLLLTFPSRDDEINLEANGTMNINGATFEDGSFKYRTSGIIYNVEYDTPDGKKTHVAVTASCVK